MQTIQLNEHLLQEAYQYLAGDLAKDIDASNNPTAVVEIVLREFIKNRSNLAKKQSSSLKDLKGKITFADDYDYKSMRG